MKTTNNIMRFLIVFMLLAAIALPGVRSGKARDARVTSTTFTVDTLSEGWDANPGDGVCATSGGKCTLRAAILETNALAGADTIILPAGNYEMTIDGALEDDSVTGDLDIRGDLTINGAGKTETFIDMNQIDRAFDLQGTNLTVQISDLTIHNGRNENSQDWDRGGGGIYLPSGSTLILEDVKLYNNKQESTYSLTKMGGAIYSQGDLTLVETDVISNTSQQGGGIFTVGSFTMMFGEITENRGGGMLIGGEAEMSSVIIAGNTYSSGGGITNSGITTISHSTISGNMAEVEGGGIWSNGTMTLIDCLVMNNEVTDGSGGGIANTYSDGVLTLIDSTVANNTAYLGGGGIETRGSGGGLTIINSQVISNTVLNGQGGGIAGVPWLLSGSRVSGNQSWGGDGGGIYAGFSWVVGGLSGYVPSFINTTIGHNIAWDGDGGGIYNQSSISMLNSTVSNNQATVHGGGIYNAGDMNLHNVTVTANTADSDSNETGNGGGIINDTGTVTLTHTILGGNLDNSTVIDYPDCDGTFTSEGYNLIQTVSPLCALEGDLTGNLTGVSPALGPLQDNGGPTLTHVPLANSPVLDAGNPDGCTDRDGAPIVSDQRGVFRPLDSDEDGVPVCDIGSVETGVLTEVQPGQSQSLVYTDTYNNITTIQIPAGAVSEAVELSFSPLITVTPLVSYTFIQNAFELLVYQNGELLLGYVFQEPVTFTVQYAENQVKWVDETQLLLMHWNGDAWSDAALSCDPPSTYTRDTVNNRLSLPLCHLGLFGAFGPTLPVVYTFLPLTIK